TVTGQITILDAKVGTKLFSRPGHSAMIVGLSVLPDGAVQTAGLDQTIIRWDPASGRERSRQAISMLKTWGIPASFSGDGRGIFGLDGGCVVHVDLATGKKTQVTTESVKPTTIIYGVSGTSVFFNINEHKVRQWDAATGQVVRDYDPPLSPNGQTSSVAH